jgi:hypothetical protein
MAIYVKLDNGRVTYAFKRAPEIFAEEIDHWLNKERVGFIGKRKSADDTRGIKGGLYHRPTESGKSGWSPNFVEQLAGIKNGKKSIAAALVMGLIGKDAKMHSTMEFLEQGGIVNSGKFMPIPNLEVLKYFGAHNQVQAHDFFKKTFDKKEFSLIKGKNGNYYVVANAGLAGSGHSTVYSGSANNRLLLFTLSKKAKVHKQYDFTKRWVRRIPGVMHRGEQAIFRATRKTEKLINEGQLGLF